MHWPRRAEPSNGGRQRQRFRPIVLDELSHVRARLLLAAASTFGVTAAELLRPWPLKIIFDQILLGKRFPPPLEFMQPMLNEGRLVPLILVSFTIVLIALLNGAFSYAQVYLTSGIANRVVYRLRGELFAHLQRLSLAFHNRARSGEVLTKVASDTNTVKDIVADTAQTAAPQVVTLLGMVAVMLALNWKLGLLVLASFPLLLWNLFGVFRRASVTARQQRRREESIATRLTEVLGAMSLVQAFGREQYEAELFDAESSAHLEVSLRSARIEAIAARAVEVTTAIGTWIVVVIGSWQVLQGEITIGSVLVFTSYLSSMYKPVRQLAKLSTRFSKAVVSAQRIAEILDVEPDVQEDPDAIDAKNVRGEIRFEHVSFSYDDGNPVLSDVSFTIPAGRRIALVGVSGAGKSTAISLILRLYDPQAGRILIDGVDIKKYRRESLRAAIGIVLQNSLLFGATIRENITYGKPDAAMMEVVAAARAANAHDFIIGLENGYETVIGERGATLSGGQRQRIALARALIRNAPILILDEPMAGLDVASEANVRQALLSLTAGRTCLLITHDLQAAADTDVVLQLEDGRVVEWDRRSELFAGAVARSLALHESDRASQVLTPTYPQLEDDHD
jgi:ATP-binding cassette, subfamily B, bacterial